MSKEEKSFSIVKEANPDGQASLQFISYQTRSAESLQLGLNTIQEANDTESFTHLKVQLWKAASELLDKAWNLSQEAI